MPHKHPLRPQTYVAHREAFEDSWRLCHLFLNECWPEGYVPAASDHAIEILAAADVLTGCVMRAGGLFHEGKRVDALDVLRAGLLEVSRADPDLWNAKNPSEAILAKELAAHRGRTKPNEQDKGTSQRNIRNGCVIEEAAQMARKNQ